MSIVNVGIDSADSARFVRLLAQDRERLFALLFGEEERAAMPTLDGKREARYLAGRWAAKEAVLKALGTGVGLITFPDVGIFSHESGQPYITLYNEATVCGQSLNIDRWHLSITHTKDISTAYVIAEHTDTQRDND